MSDKMKIAEDELKSLQEVFSKLNQAKLFLGDITAQAYVAQLEVMKHNESLIGLQRGLESKYGPITLDIETGEYEKVEQPDQESKTVTL